MNVTSLADEKIGMSGVAVPGGACLTRRAFVRLAGAAAVGAALGGAVLPRGSKVMRTPWRSWA